MFALVAHRETETNAALVAAASRWCEAERLSPRAALARLRAGDVALARLDVRSDVDGVEPGLWALGRLAARGVRVLNPPSALLTAHDKLLTARELARAGIPHPMTQLVLAGETPPAVDGPVVVKPRFGSWGRDVRLCHDELDARLHDALVGAERLTQQLGVRRVEPRQVVAVEDVALHVALGVADAETVDERALGHGGTPS